MSESAYERARRFSQDPQDAEINDATDRELLGKGRVMASILAYHHESSKDPWYHYKDQDHEDSLWNDVVDAHGGDQKAANETYGKFLDSLPKEEGSTHSAEMGRY